MKLQNCCYLGLSLLRLAGVSTAVPVEGKWGLKDEPKELPADVTMLAAGPVGTPISRTGWKVTCSSQSSTTGFECNKAIDASNTTFWNSANGTGNDPKPPHTITIDMGKAWNINGLSALPRQDGQTGGSIQQHTVHISTDGTTWGLVAQGTWWIDRTEKFANFQPKSARYVRLTSTREAQGKAWASIANLHVYASAIPPPTATGVGKWGITLNFPVIPVAGAVDPVSGKVIVWSAYKYDEFHDSPRSYTLTAEWDPKTGIITNRRVQNTDHDMFCPGISMDGNGQIVVTGGSHAEKTSIFNPAGNEWLPAADMVIARGYQSSATCSDGRVFTIGGSWSGKIALKPGEIYNPQTNTWTLLPNAKVEPMLTSDPAGLYRTDNHAWLFGWRSGTVFQAGPSTAMNWYSISGTGNVTAAGQRKTATRTDPDSMCGNAIMYDAAAGKILTIGGSPLYGGTDATSNAHIITLGRPNIPVQVKAAGTGNAAERRIFHNSVVLPNGHVLIVGGQFYGAAFTDLNPVFTPELYIPETNTFVKQEAQSIVRPYHSIALLLPDGTVFSGGGGLCGTCTANHFDAQIFTPRYLLTAAGTPATRPVINTVSAATLKVGGTLSFTTNSVITAASLVRYGTATHAINTDQRRYPLTLTTTGTTSYSAKLVNDPGIILPGYWMLFALNANGVPSVAKTIKITL